MVFLWLIVLAGVALIGHSAGSRYATGFNLPNTDSAEALRMLRANFPSRSGDVDQIVLHATSGTLEDPATVRHVSTMLSRVSRLPGVRAVVSPYGRGTGQLSVDKTVGFAQLIFSKQANRVPVDDTQRVIAVATSAATAHLQVALGGTAVVNATVDKGGGTQRSSDAIGIALTATVLFVAFGSLFSMLMPILTALVAIGIALELVALLTHVYAVANFAPILAVLIGLGVGVDYALFIISRHRSGLRAGRGCEDSIILAVDTSGRAVLFAGMTVAIALLGQFVLHLDFLYGVAVAATITVALTVLASLTLLPAMLGFLGLKALSRRERRKLASDGPQPEEVSGFWLGWARWIDGKSVIMGLSGIAVLAVLALPVTGLRLGLSDAGNNPAGSTSRQAYDLLAQGFGPGFNGPFEVAVGLPPGATSEAARAIVLRLEHALRSQRDVAAVSEPITSPDGKVVVINLYPSSAPQAEATTNLLEHLRSQTVRSAITGTRAVVRIGGPTAIGVDFSHILASKLPLFIAVVVLVSCLLLIVVFRSLLVPVTASVMNLLSVGAAFGILQAVFERGIGGSIVGVPRAGPVDVYVPVLLFSVLFGLSMDYEVFLVSRIHEEWKALRDNREAVTRGQAETGRVITAAASIMVLVFASFVYGGSRVIKEFGIGFAGAVFVDAFVIRTVLVPSVMHLLGRANWWLPRRLERLLPNVAIEGARQEPLRPACHPVTEGAEGAGLGSVPR